MALLLNISNPLISLDINICKYLWVKGRASAAKIAKLGEYGTKLAAHLVNTHKWTGIYYNPDVNHPRDGNLEHAYSYYLNVARKFSNSPESPTQ